MSVQSQVSIKLNQIFKRIENTMDVAIDANTMRDLAKFTIDLIVKRSRLGYGVSDNFGQKFKFPRLSPLYIRRRKLSPYLDDTTSATKSNITFTGQLLSSVKITKIKKGSITIGPSGTRSDSKITNEQLAAILADKGRSFMRLSQLEFNQLLRFYRKTFGDLLRKQGLLR